MAGSRPQSNFTHAKAHDQQLLRLGLLAERYFAENPNTCLLKSRQLAELLAQLVASQIGLFTWPQEKQVDLLRRLQVHGIVPREVGALFADVRRAGNDACRDRLDRVPAILNRFWQSVLGAATSVDLTEEWRATTEQPADWQTTYVGKLLTDIRYRTAEKCVREPKATPVVRIPSLLDRQASHADMKYAEFDEGEHRKLSLASGDILMIRVNGCVELVGRAAVATQGENGFLFARYLVRLRVDMSIAHPKFVSLALSSPRSRKWIELTARSTNGVNNISTEEIQALPIALPTLDEQLEIVRRVDSLFASADRLEARHAAARAQVERPTSALLAKVFRGELVPQDPADEPTFELFARLGQRPAYKPTGLPKRRVQSPAVRMRRNRHQAPERR